MRGFCLCIGYMILTGIAGFLIGRLLPKKWFRTDQFPYRSYPFEKNGHIYEKLKIQLWQKKVPDMSRIFPKLMPPKNLLGSYRERLPLMLQETCIAELTHVLLSVTGLYCLKLCPGPMGAVLVLVYILFFNLPFILIQRYNRPRLLRLNEKLRQRNLSQEYTL